MSCAILALVLELIEDVERYLLRHQADGADRECDGHTVRAGGGVSSVVSRTERRHRSRRVNARVGQPGITVD